MFCTRCGQQTPENAHFCPACGRETKIGQAAYATGAFAPKRLFRLTYDKKVAGICAGFARYLNVDVTLVRILTLTIVCITGFVPGAIAYLLAWAIMPVDDGVSRVSPLSEPTPTSAV
jgi:phage shock protein C